MNNKMKRGCLVLFTAISIALPIHAEEWPEWDLVPLRSVLAGKNAVISYQYKLKFLTVPKDAALIQNEKTRQFELKRGTVVVPADSWKPLKIWTFKHPFNLAPAEGIVQQDLLLLCTHGIFNTYTGQTPDEDKIINERTHTNWGSVVWTNEKGETDYFCGIISSDGAAKYRFPIVTGAQKPIIETVGISTDGFHATIAIGERIIVDGDDGEYPKAGNFTELWIWDEPDKLEKRKIPQTNDLQELRRQFFNKQF